MRSLSGIPGIDAPSLEALRGRDDPDAVKAVAREMEALFAYEMIKAMRETTGLSRKGGLGLDTYMSMFDQELSKLFAERGLGLQDLLTKELDGAAAKSRQAGDPQDAHKSSRGADAAGNVPGKVSAVDIRAILPDNAGNRVSSDFGMRPDPFTGEEKFHEGLDIPAPEGAAIHPVKAGTVLFSGEQKGYGNLVIIDHGDGYVSKYAHASENLVKEGDKVDPASVIARAGSTGRSTGSHVHFEVRYRGEKVNPRTFLAKR